MKNLYKFNHQKKISSLNKIIVFAVSMLSCVKDLHVREPIPKADENDPFWNPLIASNANGNFIQSEHSGKPRVGLPDK